MYALANVLDDERFLAISQPGQMTDHATELYIIAAVAKDDIEKERANSIIFHAGIYGHGRLHLADIEAYTPPTGSYYVALIDYRREGKDFAHTVAALWGPGRYCIYIDPQKTHPAYMAKTTVFETVQVIGFRYVSYKVEGGMEFPVLMAHNEIRHIVK